MIYLRFDVIKKMKENGFPSTRLQREGLIAGRTLKNIRQSYDNCLPLSVSMDTLNTICLICGMQPGEVIEVRPTDEEKIKFFHITPPSSEKSHGTR